MTSMLNYPCQTDKEQEDNVPGNRKRKGGNREGGIRGGIRWRESERRKSNKYAYVKQY